MRRFRPPDPSRRTFVAGVACLVAAPAIAQRSGTADYRAPVTDETRRNASSFRTLDWRPYFDTLAKGAILCDVQSRALHFWGADESVYKLYPTSVPQTDELTRRGRTEVIRKVEGPSWAPTPEMKERNPDWPDFIGPGPDNPLGTHALYLGWQYYRIHGTQDTRKIGRRSSNGCIGLYNQHIAELFGLATVGAQVLLI